VFGRVDFKKFDPNDPMSRQGQKEIFLSQCVEDGKAKRLTEWVVPKN
jgi:branched-chain amino acid transport system substrate-binding protein